VTVEKVPQSASEQSHRLTTTRLSTCVGSSGRPAARRPPSSSVANSGSTSFSRRVFHWPDRNPA